MNNPIIKLGIRLFMFCLVAAVALAITNEVTKGPIAQRALETQMAALKKVMPDGEYEESTFEGELPEGSELDAIYISKNHDGSIMGYALVTSPNGYGGEIPITIGVSNGGYVTQVHVGALQETAGLGSKVGDDAFLDQFIGIPADDDTLRSDVDLISGASISSGAFLNATEQVFAYTENVLGIKPAPGNKEDILAAYNAANGVSEEPVISTAEYSVTGFGDLKVEVALDQNGVISSVKVTEHNETDGIGKALIDDQSVFDALVGKNISDAAIDVRAGATLTSNAINDALSQAKAAFTGGAEGSSTVYDVTGFAPMKVDVKTDADGKIVSVEVVEHTETEGIGAALIADKNIFDALVGQDIKSAQIDVRAGATLTSNAINEALKMAAKSGEGASTLPAGDPITVKGLNKFTVYIDVQDGKIASISVPSHSETPGLGADLLTEDALSTLVGQKIDEAHVDAKTGVTLTVDALQRALNVAAQVNGFEVQEEAKTEEAKTEEAAAEGPVTGAAFSNTYPVKGIADFKVTVELDSDGKILNVTVPEHQETVGLGADLIEDKAVFAALKGQDIRDAKIDVKTAVTLTSNAINEALSMAAAEFAGTAKTQIDEKDAATDVSTVKTVAVTGFAPFTVEIALNPNGEIVNINIPENQETAGLGADLIADTAIFEALVGKPVAQAQIDVKSGVTLTSNAINEALKKAAEEFSPAKAAEETPAKAAKSGSYPVKGFAEFTVNVEVDDNGNLLSVTIPEHQETAGLGADLIADTAIFEALVGKPVAQAQIDVKTGVTLTSNAINEALKKAAEELSAAPAAEEKAIPEKSDEATPAETAARRGSFPVKGFADFTVVVEVDDEGKILSVSVPEHQETAGLGADLIADSAVFEALVGKPVAQAQIDVKTGVTLTSNAINEALKNAAEEFAAPAGEAAAETKVYEATGFAPMKVAVQLDADGKILSVEVKEHNETAGLGADLIADAGVFEALVGKNIGEAQIDVKTGVTLTSNAINDVLSQAAKEVQK